MRRNQWIRTLTKVLWNNKSKWCLSFSHKSKSASIHRSVKITPLIWSLVNLPQSAKRSDKLEATITQDWTDWVLLDCTGGKFEKRRSAFFQSCSFPVLLREPWPSPFKLMFTYYIINKYVLSFVRFSWLWGWVTWSIRLGLPVFLCRQHVF